MTWQSGQLNERFDAKGIEDERLKQQRVADWAASCASSGTKTATEFQVNTITYDSFPFLVFFHACSATHFYKVTGRPATL